LNKKPKILYLIDTLNVGGAEKSLVEMAIQNNETEPVFISIYKGCALQDLLHQNNIKVYCLNHDKKFDPKGVLKKLIPLVKEIQPDIVHATLLRSELIARKLKSEFNFKLIGSFVSDSYGKEKYKKMPFSVKIKHFIFQLYNILTARKVDLFISNSENIKLKNAKALHIPLDKVKVIYRGRKADTFEKITNNDTQKIIKEFKLKENKVLITVGRLINTKAHSEIIKAFAELSKQFPDWKLLIVGEGPQKNNLKELINHLQMEHQIILTGNRNDVPALLKTATAFVFASHLEGLPGAIIEAMFAKIPILCSDIPENLECVSAQEALIFEKGNIKDLQENLKKLMSNPEKYSYLAQNAQKKAIKMFELHKIIAQYNKTYLNLLKKQ
jgi:glycosyltransferase involved in cell wall biosynthesis